ncbi:LysM domain/BON superfamily protein [Gimesia fumaroli]|uniref:LysM domain/BON superfamily protein n=2 Tax=Gimesia fumaroli TaxID=2527976 RepID=A0A518IAR2_9PLAN|nr:LysM domain/BON superfamily protein [Gimesia fumaroli]
MKQVGKQISVCLENQKLRLNWKWFRAMTEEKKAEQASEEDWGVEKPKSGIAIETKVGLCLICILLSAFGLVVYQKINRPQEDLAVNSPAEETPESDQSKTESDPFAEGNPEAGTTGQLASQSNGFDTFGNEPDGENSGFSTPQEEQGNPFAEPQPEAQGAGQFAQNAFDNQSEPAQPTEMAANQSDTGFQQFDQPAGASNEFANPAQNEFQNEMPQQPDPAAFDNGQQDPFAGGDQFAQQPAGAAASQTAPQQNEFNVGTESEFAPPAAGADSGLMEQPAGQEFAQTPAANTFQDEPDPFGGAAAQQGQVMQQPQQPAENAFDEFGSSESLNTNQMQNTEEFSEKPAKVNITEISSPSDANAFGDAGFSQSEPQESAAQLENAFGQGQDAVAMDNQQFEQPQASEFSEPNPGQSEERFGNFRPEEFSAQQAESVTTVKRPAAAIDSGTFRDSAMPAEQVPQAQGLFDSPAPVREVSTQEFGSQQQDVFNQQPTVPTGGEYVVQNGENFWTISKKLYGSGRYFQLLAEMNRSRVSDPRKMRPGLKLIAPDQGTIDAEYRARHKATQTMVSEFSGQGGSRKSSKPAGFFISQDGRPMYRVGSSDTLTDISQKHLGRSSRWYQIYQINRQRLQNPNKLQIGAELQLPYDASRVSLVPGKSSSR